MVHLRFVPVTRPRTRCGSPPSTSSSGPSSSGATVTITRVGASPKRARSGRPAAPATEAAEPRSTSAPSQRPSRPLRGASGSSNCAPPVLPLAECCIASGSTGGAQFEDPEAPRGGRDGRWLGADVDLGSAASVAGAAGRPDLALFGEAPTRVIVTVAPELLGPLDEVLGGLPHRVLGRVTGTNLRCTMQGKELFTVPVAELHSAYESLPQRLA